MIERTYEFIANTTGDEDVDGVGTCYFADDAGGPYLTLQRSKTDTLPQPEDPYIEYGDQSAGSYGSLKRFRITRAGVTARIEGGTTIRVKLQVSDDVWESLSVGLDRLLAGPRTVHSIRLRAE